MSLFQTLTQSTIAKSREKKLLIQQPSARYALGLTTLRQSERKTDCNFRNLLGKVELKQGEGILQNYEQSTHRANQSCDTVR